MPNNLTGTTGPRDNIQWIFVDHCGQNSWNEYETELVRRCVHRVSERLELGTRKAVEHLILRASIGRRIFLAPPGSLQRAAHGTAHRSLNCSAGALHKACSKSGTCLQMCRHGSLVFADFPYSLGADLVGRSRGIPILVKQFTMSGASATFHVWRDHWEGGFTPMSPRAREATIPRMHRKPKTVKTADTHLRNRV